MPRRDKKFWMLCLADPQGPADALPDRPIRTGEIKTLLELADAHGVLGALTANLRRAGETHGAGRIVACRPGETCERQLEAALQAAGDILRKRTAKCLLIRRQIEEISRPMSEAGLDFVILKGAEFADRLYDEPSLRPFTDADVLIAPEAKGQAETLMQRLGYRAKPTSMKYDRGYGEQSFIREDIEGAVEIHWNLVNSPTLRKGVSVTFADLQIDDVEASSPGRRHPSPGSLLLIAAVHAAASHCFDRLQLLCDITQAARQTAGPVDKEWLRKSVRTTGAALAMAAGLGLAGETLSETACHELAEELGLGGLRRWRGVLTKGMVLRSHARVDSLRRNLFRAMLKRKR